MRQWRPFNRRLTTWLPIASAPSDADLEVCVMDSDGIHALVFPCRKNGTEWVDASTKKYVDCMSSNDYGRLGH
jgi:hypothetical protein